MADWLMHYAAGRVATATARPSVFRECILLGALIPDLPSKMADAVLELHWAASFSHTPLIWGVIAYVLSHAFVERLRPSAFGGLLLGGWVHIVVDLGKDNMGAGSLMLGFPFVWKTCSLGFYYPENSLAQAPWCLAVILVVEWLSRRRAASTTAPGGSRTS